MDILAKLVITVALYACLFYFMKLIKSFPYGWQRSLGLRIALVSFIDGFLFSIWIVIVWLR